MADTAKFNGNAHNAKMTQAAVAFAEAFDKADPMPTPTPEVVTKPEAPAPAAPVQAQTAPKPDKYDALASENKALKEEFAKLQQALKAAAGVKEEAPARVTAKTVDEEVKALREELQALRGESTRSATLQQVSQQLPNVPDYATMKDIPDLASKVAAEQEALRVAAEERGEGATEVSVAAALKSLKDRRVAEVKALLANEDLLREVGLSTSSQESRSSASRALTSDLTAQGGQQKQVVKDINAHKKGVFANALRALDL